MITLLTKESLAELAAVQKPPCLSLYLGTHRLAPQNQQDPIRFRNLLRDLQTSLLERYAESEHGSLLKPFESLAHDREFWNHAQDGLAVLGAAGLFRVFRLQRPVQELAVAADSFHTKPLRQFLQSADRYLLLGLGLSTVRLFEGNRDTLDEIAPAPGVPGSIAEAREEAGAETPDPHQTVASYGGAGGGSAAMHHGHGGKADATEKDTERFFRAVDRAVLEHHSRPSGLPLMLVALPEHHHLVREVSHNPFLMEEGLSINPDALSLDALRTRAWQVIEPQHQARVAASIDDFKSAQAKSLGDDDLARVTEAALAGRVGTLLIEADRQIPGDPPAEDLLDDLGELVTRAGGQVKVLQSDQMPSRTGLAAIYRY